MQKPPRKSPQIFHPTILRDKFQFPQFHVHITEKWLEVSSWDTINFIATEIVAPWKRKHAASTSIKTNSWDDIKYDRWEMKLFRQTKGAPPSQWCALNFKLMLSYKCALLPANKNASRLSFSKGCPVRDYPFYDRGSTYSSRNTVNSLWKLCTPSFVIIMCGIAAAVKMFIW